MTQLIARFSLFSPYVQCSLRTVTVHTDGKERERQVCWKFEDNATKMIHFIFMGHTTGFGDNYTFYCMIMVWWYDDSCIYMYIHTSIHICTYMIYFSYSIQYVFYTGFFLCLPVRSTPVGCAKNLYFKFLVNFPSFAGCMCDFGIGCSCWQDRNFSPYALCVCVRTVHVWCVSCIYWANIWLTVYRLKQSFRILHVK